MRRPMVWACVAAGWLAGPEGLERVGKLDDPAIVEASGVVRSRRHPGTFWVHNDSGNPPVLFAVKADGRLVRSYRVEAPNVDWEDIAADDRGHLYVGDIGNNNLRLPARAIHRFDEPDPGVAPDGPLKPTLSTFYRFEDGKRFDAEGLFVSGDRAFLVSKWRDGREAEIYSVPLDPPAPMLRPATPKWVGKLPGCTEPATGADLSPDGTLLAVVTDKSARVYRRDEKGEGWSPLATVRFDARDVEAICWDGLDLVLASEDRSIYRIAEATWRGAKPETPREGER